MSRVQLPGRSGKVRAMQLHWRTDLPTVSQAPGVVTAHGYGVRTDTPLNTVLGDSMGSAAKAGGFEGKPHQSFRTLREIDGVAQWTLLAGCGDALTADVVWSLAREAARCGATHAVLDLRGHDISAISAQVSVAALLSDYRFERHRSEASTPERRLSEVTIVHEQPVSDADTARAVSVARAITRARDLVNGPPGVVTPTYLASEARAWLEATTPALAGATVELTVLDRAQCEARGMGCYLGVAQGSDEPPQFIHLSYVPPNPTKRVALIGKGVTFDSGGYSIKPSDGMLDMKMDMAGSAAVLAAFFGAVELGTTQELHCIVAACENLVSGHAYKLGDVLTASNGVTVEINNTDAEGRLTMADALVYAGALKPDYTIDFATLTGACMVALGPRIAGVMTRDEALHDSFMGAATRAGESMWRLPLPTDLNEQLKSKIADCRNTGERMGGALTAGLFLERFTKGQRWMHVDIAGPAFFQKPHGVAETGGTGFPVATILQWLQDGAL